MDAAAFVASIVRSVAWPATVLAAAYLFRREVGSLLGNIQQATIGDVVLVFRTQLGELERSVAGEAPAVVHGAPEATGLSPADTIDAAWLKLEHALRAVAGHRDLGDGRGSFRDAELSSTRVLEPETIGQVRQLKQLRNSALGGRLSLTTDDARRFAAVAAEVATKLRPG